MSRDFLRLALILGLATAVGLFAVDMYLPALPTIGASLHASPASVQMSLMVFFITVGLFQILFGAISDVIGRNAPMCAGLVIFGLGSIGCAVAWSMESLIAFRFVQAFGACAGMVLPRAMIRALHTGPEATRLMSLIMLVTSISPMLAPLLGSLILTLATWHMLFWVIAVAALAALILVATQLGETHLAAARARSVRDAFAAYRPLLGDSSFIGLSVVGALGSAAFFVYLANAAFVLIGHYGLSPFGFSLCFALNAGSLIGFSQFTARLTERFGLRRVILFSATGFATATVLLTCYLVAGTEQLWPLIVALFIGYGFLGLLMPSVTVLALANHGPRAGAASALMGSLQMIVGAAAMGSTGWLGDGRPVSMVAGIAICSTLALAVIRLVLRRTAPEPETA